MKKRWIALILVAALLCGTGIFLLVTGGRTYVEDGLGQNSRIYFTNIIVEDGRIYHTLVNNTCRRFNISYTPTVQKKINGDWFNISLTRGEPSVAIVMRPFSGHVDSFKIERSTVNLEGEYRLKEEVLEGVWAVGYFTITAEAVETGDVPDFKLYSADGLCQSEKLYMSDVTYEEGKIKCTVVNELEEKMTYCWPPVIEKRVDGVWKYVTLYDKQALELFEDVSANGGNDYSEVALHVGGVELVGEYRLVASAERFGAVDFLTDPDTGETSVSYFEDTLYIVGYLTITEDMVE
ncbi:MAG: hypothetical protein IJX39_00680 [Clostridia bacterium]|nr:hypothetical protein [Clostridia bacterium]